MRTLAFIGTVRTNTDQGIVFPGAMTFSWHQRTGPPSFLLEP